MGIFRCSSLRKMINGKFNIKRMKQLIAFLAVALLMVIGAVAFNLVDTHAQPEGERTVVELYAVTNHVEQLMDIFGVETWEEVERIAAGLDEEIKLNVMFNGHDYEVDHELPDQIQEDEVDDEPLADLDVYLEDEVDEESLTDVDVYPEDEVDDEPLAILEVYPEDEVVDEPLTISDVYPEDNSLAASESKISGVRHDTLTFFTEYESFGRARLGLHQQGHYDFKDYVTSYPLTADMIIGYMGCEESMELLPEKHTFVVTPPRGYALSGWHAFYLDSEGNLDLSAPARVFTSERGEGYYTATFLPTRGNDVRAFAFFEEEMVVWARLGIQPFATETWQAGWPTVDGVNWAPAPLTRNPSHTYVINTSRWGLPGALDLLPPYGLMGSSVRRRLDGIVPLAPGLIGFPPSLPVTGWPSRNHGGVIITNWQFYDNMVINITGNITMELTTLSMTAHVPPGATVVVRSSAQGTRRTISPGTLNLLAYGRHFNVAGPGFISEILGTNGGRLILQDVILCGGTTWNPVQGILSLIDRGGVEVGAPTTGFFGSPAARLYMGPGSEIRNSTGGNQGGGVYLQSGGLPLIDAIVRANGGVITMHPGSTIHNNTAQYGGGLFANEGSMARIAGTIRNNTANTFPLPSVVLPNPLSRGSGGGIRAEGAAVTLWGAGELQPGAIGAVIRDNDAHFGGGISMTIPQGLLSGLDIFGLFEGGSSLRMFGGIIENNTALEMRTYGQVIDFPFGLGDSGQGGGIHSNLRTDITIYDGWIRNNNAQGWDHPGITFTLNRPQRGFGGGIYGTTGTVLTMHNGRIYNNEAVYGGGVMIQGDRGLLNAVDIFDLLPYAHVNFYMYGGYINDNLAREHRAITIVRGGSGGGVRVDAMSRFVMRGGEIYDNRALGRHSTDQNGVPGGGRGGLGGNGGGVSIGDNDWFWGVGDFALPGNMYMLGGRIADNYAAANGGGIGIQSGRGWVFATWGTPAVLHVLGGEIVDNEAGRNGGGIWLMANSQLNIGYRNATSHRDRRFDTRINIAAQHDGLIHACLGSCVDYNQICTSDCYCMCNHLLNIPGCCRGRTVPIIEGNEAASYGGGVWVARDTDFFIDYVNIHGNTAGLDGGGLFLHSPSYGNPLPGTAYRLSAGGTGTLQMGTHMWFERNVAGNGWYQPPINAGNFGTRGWGGGPRMRWAYDSDWGTSFQHQVQFPLSSIYPGPAWTPHFLNNYDVNYRDVAHQTLWFTKLDNEGYPLSGAEFRLERESPRNSGNWVPAHTAEEYNNELPASGRTITSSNIDLIYGRVDGWHISDEGRYRLTEVRPAPGFVAPYGHWYVTRRVEWLVCPVYGTDGVRRNAANCPACIEYFEGNPPGGGFPCVCDCTCPPYWPLEIVRSDDRDPDFYLEQVRIFDGPPARYSLRWQIRNYRPVVDIFKWSNVTREGLEGVEFTLYRVSSGDGVRLPTGYVDTDFITGAYRPCHNHRIRLDLSPNSTYRLVETAVVDGYILPTGYWLFVVDARGNVVATSHHGNPVLHNHPPWDSNWERVCRCGEPCEHYGTGNCTCNLVCTHFCSDCQCIACPPNDCERMARFAGENVFHVINNQEVDRVVEIYKWSNHTRQGLGNAGFTLEIWCHQTSDWIPHPEHPTLTTVSPYYRLSLNLSTGGRYRLREIASPEEYRLPEGYWVLDVENNGEVTITTNQVGAEPPLLRESHPWTPIECLCECHEGQECCVEVPGCECPEVLCLCECEEGVFHLVNYRYTFDFPFHKTCQLIYNQQNWDDPEWLEEILLAGASFQLFRFNGPGSPGDGIVTEDMIGFGPDQWARVGNPQESSGDINEPIVFHLTPGSVYHLVETESPGGFQLPLGQWRIVAVESMAGEIGFRIVAVGDSTIPAFVNINGEFNDDYNAWFDGTFFVGNRRLFDIPDLGGIGSRIFLMAGVAILSTAMGWSVQSIRNKKRKNVSS